DQGLGVFLRFGAAPADRNLVAFYGDAGVTMKGAIPGRADDVAGIALAVAAIGARARALDADQRRFSGQPRPIRDGEAVLEVTYRYQLSPWWTVQPDLQFIRHPGAGAAAPDNPTGTRRIPNATVLGLRSAIVF